MQVTPDMLKNLNKEILKRGDEEIYEDIIITKSDHTNLITIIDNEGHSTNLTLTNKDLVTLMLLSNQLKKGERRTFEKERKK